MDDFFLFLYDKFMPFLGELFGKVSALAMANWNDAFDYLMFVNGASINYVNFFTGVSGVMHWSTNLVTIITTSLAVPVRSFISFLTLFVPSGTPFVVALLIFSFVNGIGLHIARFIWGIVAG